MTPTERLAQLEAKHKKLGGLIGRLEALEARVEAVEALLEAQEAIRASYGALVASEGTSAGVELSAEALLDRQGWAS